MGFLGFKSSNEGKFLNIIFVNSVKYWYLLQEFLRPSIIGGYYNGKQYFYSNDSFTKPSRFYLAISHGCLYSQTLYLPDNIPSNKITKALSLEASRIFHFLEGQTEPVMISVLMKKKGSYLISFREKSFFKRICEDVPNPLIICGIFPAWVSLLAWCWHKYHGFLRDGLYFVRTNNGGIEGFIWYNGRLENILPFTPSAGELLFSKFRDKIFQVSSSSAEIILAQGAALVPYLPKNWQVSFNKIKLRPQIPKKTLFLGLIPFLLWGIGIELQHQIDSLQRTEKQLENKIKLLETKEKKLQEKLEEKIAIQKIALKLQGYQKRPPLIEILSELAQLPNGTWIRKFDFQEPDIIQIWGESNNTIQILNLLEKSPYLKEVKVISTVTKNPRTGKENFVLRAYIEKK